MTVFFRENSHVVIVHVACSYHVLFGHFRAIAHGNVLSFCGNRDLRLKQNAKNCAQPPSFASTLCPLRGDIRKNWNDTEEFFVFVKDFTVIPGVVDHSIYGKLPFLD
jgi:hypothetical protein